MKVKPETAFLSRLKIIKGDYKMNKTDLKIIEKMIKENEKKIEKIRLDLWRLQEKIIKGDFSPIKHINGYCELKHKGLDNMLQYQKDLSRTEQIIENLKKVYWAR